MASSIPNSAFLITNCSLHPLIANPSAIITLSSATPVLQRPSTTISSTVIIALPTRNLVPTWIDNNKFSIASFKAATRHL